MVTTATLIDSYNGTSLDTKPTDGVRNGSEFFEMYTGKTYKFDEANSEWLDQTPAQDGDA